MKKSTRVLCLVIAAAFVATLLFSIVMSIAYAEGETAASRGETVYVTADANGNVESVISSVYLSNIAKTETLTDYTNLTGIKAVTTNEPPVINGDAVTFVAEGEDVSYQGTAQTSDLPFSVQITYYLNGKKIEPEELAGQDGHLRMEITTENHLKHTVEIDGEMTELYVPFSIVSMLTFDESFSGVTADHAKVSIQAGQVTVLGVLMPGLAESLEVEPGDKINDTLTVEATVKDFSFSGGVFIGMTGIVDQNDLSGIEDVETLIDAIGELNDAASELYKGAHSLDNAAETYAEGVTAYVEGIMQAMDGIDEMEEGVSELYSGARLLADGSDEITDGLEQLAEQLATLRGALATMESGQVSEELYQMLLPYAYEIAEITLEKSGNTMRAAMIDKLKAEMPEGTPDETIQAIANAVIPEHIEPSADLSEAEKAIIAKQVAEILAESTSAQTMIGQVDALIAGVNQLAGGSGELTSGMNSLASGLRQLRDGLREYGDAATELEENGNTLAEGADSIASGIGKIASGLRTLADEGMQQLVDETSEIDVSLSRKDALVELSQSYNAFSATREPKDGTVQFLVSTAEIEPELPIEPSPSPEETEPADQDVQTEETSGFFERIGNWFTEVFEGIRGWFAG